MQFSINKYTTALFLTSYRYKCYHTPLCNLICFVTQTFVSRKFLTMGERT